MDYESNFIDQLYDFKGMWDMPSRCGLKVVKNENRQVVIFTEIYNENPGSSITDVCGKLCNQICSEFDLNPQKTVFIQHIPDIGSKYEFLKEEFDKVTFKYENNELSDPDWNNISKEEVENLIN
jgi:hypothetical protein